MFYETIFRGKLFKLWKVFPFFNHKRSHHFNSYWGSCFILYNSRKPHTLNFQRHNPFSKAGLHGKRNLKKNRSNWRACHSCLSTLQNNPIKWIVMKNSSFIWSEFGVWKIIIYSKTSIIRRLFKKKFWTGYCGN